MSARTAGFQPCPTLIFVDGMPANSINDVPPALLGAVEFYPWSAVITHMRQWTRWWWQGHPPKSARSASSA